MEVYILPEDIRHGDHLHCGSGIRRFCTRTGVDFDTLMRGEITAEELRATGQHMGIETASNAEVRVAQETQRSADASPTKWESKEHEA